MALYMDKNGSRVKIPAALVVSAFGYKAYDPISEISGKYCGEVCRIGCSVKARNALIAVREGYETAFFMGICYNINRMRHRICLLQRYFGAREQVRD